MKNKNREKWAAHRILLEKEAYKNKTRSGVDPRTFFLAELFAFFLRFTPLYAQGLKNAVYPRQVDLTLYFKNLPKSFDRYTILHLTDLHLDSHRTLAQRTADLIKEIQKTSTIDLCLMTGDYSSPYKKGAYRDILKPMKTLVSALTPKDGIFAVLGNHDTQAMVNPFEEMGIRVLVNETAEIEKEGVTLSLTGLDDPSYYYSPACKQAFEGGKADFKIAAVHSPGLYKEAAEKGMDLYLTGHTHGGQICLPGGRPIIRRLKRGRRFYKGLWGYRQMQGYTGQGLGTVVIPIRFNTFSEITLIQLRSGSGQSNPGGNQ